MGGSRRPPTGGQSLLSNANCQIEIIARQSILPDRNHCPAIQIARSQSLSGNPNCQTHPDTEQLMAIIAQQCQLPNRIPMLYNSGQSLTGNANSHPDAGQWVAIIALQCQLPKRVLMLGNCGQWLPRTPQLLSE